MASQESTRQPDSSLDNNAASWRSPPLAMLALTPLLVLPIAHDPFQITKMAWLHVLALVLLTWGAARILRGNSARVPLTPLCLAVLGFFIWHLIRTPFAESPSLATDRTLHIGALLVVFFQWRSCLRTNDRNLTRTTAALAITCALTAIWALYQDMHAAWDWPLPRLVQTANLLGDWRGNITAGMGNTDFIAAFLATAYLPVLGLCVHARQGLRHGLLLVTLWLMTAALIVCWSVGGNGALILGTLCLLLLAGRKRLKDLWRLHARPLLLWATGCLLVIGWLCTPNPVNPHTPGIFQQAFGSERWHEGGPTRGVIWLNSMEMIRQNQLTGVGPGNFSYVYPRIRSPFVPLEAEWQRYQGSYTNAAHNSLMQTWAELGIPGLVLLVLMAFQAFRAMLCARHEMPDADWRPLLACAALAVLCFDSFMTFPLYLPTLTLLFFLLLPVGEVLLHHAGATPSLPAMRMDYGYVETSIELADDMRTPRALTIALNLPPAIRTSASIVCVGICIALTLTCLRPPLASVYYAQARAARMQAQSPIQHTNAEATAGLLGNAEILYEKTLRLWPDYHDARSEYSQFLVDQQRWREALEQLETVMQRLDSRELYLRRQQAHSGLGDEAAARRDARIFQQRLPYMPQTEDGPP